MIGSVKEINAELEARVAKEVFVTKKTKVFTGGKMRLKLERVPLYRVRDNKLYIPFAWALANTPLVRRDRSNFGALVAPFVGVLNEPQRDVKGEAIQRLNEYGSVLLSLHVGFGKTVLSVFLATKIGLKTLVVTHLNVLQRQWTESFTRFTGGEATVSVVMPKGKEAQFGANVLIVSPDNLKKIGAHRFLDVGLVILDEVHCLLGERRAECLWELSPRFLIGLSATPPRPDGLGEASNFYFGTGPGAVIFKKLFHPHIVHKIETNFEYEADNTSWSRLIGEQSLNVDRNRLICGLVTDHPHENFLIMCNLVAQAEFLYAALTGLGEACDLLVGATNTYSETSRVIIATFDKASFGFSCDRLNALILASDVISTDTSIYMVQILGRIMRTREVKPIVFDIVDVRKVFHDHFRIRKRVYEEHGGVLQIQKV